MRRWPLQIRDHPDVTLLACHGSFGRFVVPWEISNAFLSCADTAQKTFVSFRSAVPVPKCAETSIMLRCVEVQKNTL